MKGLYSKLCILIKRGLVTLSGNDSNNYPVCQVAFVKKTKTVEIVSPYGLYSNLPTGAQMIVFTVQAQEENLAGIGYNSLTRFKNLAEGEVVVGNPSTGAFVKFSADGSVTVCTSGAVNISCADCTINASGNIALGSGGAKVARYDDEIQVTDSNGVLCKGKITGGSSKVTSA
jgi:phage gp45-like